MSSPFDPPPGDPAAVSAACAQLSHAANDVTTQVSAIRGAMVTSVGHWVAPRADDFRHAALAIVDEVSMTASALGYAYQLLSGYARQLQEAISEVAGYKASADAVQARANQVTQSDSPSADMEQIHAATRIAQLERLAMTTKSDLQTYANRVAAALDEQTALAAPKGASLSPDEIRRKVDARLGVTALIRDAAVHGSVGAVDAWRLMSALEGPVFEPDAPKPGDPGFTAWFAGLTPVQRELESQKLAAGFGTKGFDPYSTIQPGQLPPWASQFNDQQANMCTPDNPTGENKYGYFGGGTIAGPGGANWPIVMPYYRDGEHVYMADSGAGRPDGGIGQLDGNDPGWHTVTTYSGLGRFGSVSGSTKFWTGLLIATGQELETTATDPEAVVVDSQGRPFAGKDVHEGVSGPEDKPFWDVESESMMPEEAKPALGANALLVQTGQALNAVHNLDSHAERQWYVSYQVNDDGRTRAVVHTYTAGPGENDKTVVGSFANAFPTGQHGSTSEIPYNTRFNPYEGTVMTATPDPKVEYLGQGEPLENREPINEVLNK